MAIQVLHAAKFSLYCAHSSDGKVKPHAHGSSHEGDAPKLQNDQQTPQNAANSKPAANAGEQAEQAKLPNVRPAGTVALDVDATLDYEMTWARVRSLTKHWMNLVRPYRTAPEQQTPRVRKFIQMSVNKSLEIYTGPCDWNPNVPCFSTTIAPDQPTKSNALDAALPTAFVVGLAKTGTTGESPALACSQWQRSGAS
jgi:hypothetical protein